MGPVNRARLDSLAALGVVQAETPVREGREGPWRTYETPVVIGNSVPPPLRIACTSCGETFPPNALLTYEERLLCGSCKVSFFQHRKQGTWADHYELTGALWKRALAKLLDFNIFLMVALFSNSWLSDLGASVIWSGLFSLICVGALLAFFVYSLVQFGGTPGKRALRLAVVDVDNRRLGYGLAFTRLMAECISFACLTMGYIMALVDPDRMTLHDRICQTRVVAERAVTP